MTITLISKHFELQGWDWTHIRFKSPDYSSQKGKRYTKQNKKVLYSLNRKIFRHASKLLQSHWPRRYSMSLYISKQKIICKSILSWPVGFEKKNWSSCLMWCWKLITCHKLSSGDWNWSKKSMDSKAEFKAKRYRDIWSIHVET